MKGVSLEKLVNDPKAAITKIKSNGHSSFLSGVAHYPNLPPRHRVAQQYPKVFYRKGTLLFVAIPYLGQEPVSTAHFREEPSPLPNNIHKEGLCNKVAEKLTAYHAVDNYPEDSSSNSSLSLFQYKFPFQPDMGVFNRFRTVLNADGQQTTAGTDERQATLDIDKKEELIAVHQIIFMVLDDG